MSGDSRLYRIQQLQFTNRAAAETLLLDFVRETFPELDVVKIELRPLAVSLNSFNGFMTVGDGRRLFYKTHVEPGSVINEYYNSTLLAQAGYPIIKPIFSSTEYGKQFLVYDVIESPSVFDVAHAIDRGERDDLPALAAAQHSADDLLLEIYRHTLEQQCAEQAAEVAVQQLFYHRLGARYQEFYVGKHFALPGGLEMGWETLCRCRWQINGKRYLGTIGEAVETARCALDPARAGPSIIGHGDAHNGNVFLTPDGLVYFDPAFGGRHHPLLDLTKPLFHNVSATWMYHPDEVLESLEISLHPEGDLLVVEHNYRPSTCRRMFFESKMERVLKPLIADLGGPRSLKAYLQSALMCCPLLTMNLSTRFPAPITLLGLCYTVEMAFGDMLDEVFP